MNRINASRNNSEANASLVKKIQKENVLNTPANVTMHNVSPRHWPKEQVEKVDSLLSKCFWLMDFCTKGFFIDNLYKYEERRGEERRGEERRGEERRGEERRGEERRGEEEK
jgi:hypothetical protein